MLWRRLVVCTLLCAVLPAGLTAQKVQRGSIYRIPVHGVIELGLAPFIARSISEAERAGARAVVLDIETPGGRVDAASKLSIR